MNTLKLFSVLTEKDLLIANALSVLLTAAVVLLPDTPLRTVLGIPFVLFFPGYTLLSAVFPEKKDLGTIERIALSAGVSLAVVVLVGLALNYTPWGIRLIPTVSSLFVLSLSLSFVSIYRRSKLPVENRTNLPTHVRLPKWSTLKRQDKLFAIVILISILATAGVAVYLAVSPKIGQRFTEFYVLDSNNEIADYPVNVTLGENCTVILGVVNHEYESASYRICVNVDNQTIQTLDGIQLDNQMNWTQKCTFEPKIVGEAVRVDLELYKDGLVEPYRNLHLWINVQAPQ